MIEVGGCMVSEYMNIELVVAMMSDSVGEIPPTPPPKSKREGNVLERWRTSASQL